MDSIDLLSLLGLTIQCAGIILITALSFFMTRSIRRVSLDYWTIAWVCFSLSLLSLAVGFRIASLEKFFFAIYYFGEYAFGFMFIAGCRNYASGFRLTRRDLRLLTAGIVIALGLAYIPGDFDTKFILHAAIVAGLFGGAFYALRPARSRHPSPGLRVMSVALVLLTLDFLHYVPVMAYVKLWDVPYQLTYLRYTSIYDLILEMLLGFGTVMVVMEDARREIEVANRDLIAARDNLERLARVDPLTEALNRHAFYSLIEKRREAPDPVVSGCVVILDIDNMKLINDSLGHTAGDAAIREVARSVRSAIRADDLLFRWGGDEFLILLLNISEIEARKRINELDAALVQTRLPNSTVPIEASYGLALFSSMAQIEQAIEKADSAMYVCKHARKSQDKRQIG